MKQWVRDILISMMLGFLLPGLILNFGAKVRRQATEETVRQEVAVSVPLPARVRDEQGRVTQQQMDEYLVGVVLAEMPAFFEPEALKAQSVVARTYAWKAYSTGGKHGDGSVCMDPSCCQGYTSEEDYLQRGGMETDAEKIRAAVLSTSGQVLTYDGELIEATYFSCSGGSTEDAEAVWGADFPYLQAVASPGEEEAAHYRDTAVFSKAELEEKLGITLSGQPESWVRSVSYTEGGGVDVVSIGGTFFTGVEVRQKLDLQSTAFSMGTEGESLVFSTRGYGHRVGMSQYGADAMAVDGHTYEEILAHYYLGTEVNRIETE